MHRPVALIVLLCLMRASGLSQSDTASYRAALAVQSDSARITALVHFLDQFPRSAFRGGAYNALFGLYVRRGNEPQALGTAAQYLQTMAPESRMNPYNQIAYALAEAGLGLDSALAYATRSEEMARGEGSGALGAIQDTRAFVLYRKGDVAAAENLQMEAMRGHEDDPEYVGHLALYQEGNGKRKLALLTISRAMYMGAGRDMETRFFQWLSLEERDPGRREALKDSIVMRTVHSFIDTLREGQAVAAKSTAAAFMARMSVDLSRAEKFALDAVGSLVKSSPAEETVAFRQNLAMVTAARGKYRDALLALQSIENLVSPWSTDFWMALGGAYQRTGQPEKAVGAYMNGLTVIAPAELRDTLEVVYRKVHGSTEGLDAEVERVKQSGAAFDPGRYDSGGQGSGKVLLAELFTGAECGPCVASDIAFDALEEYYPRGVLSILEYHVHIPGPDPLTTNESWKRYQMYRGGGTPTVVIDGRESILGGGPKYVARNRFNLYRYAISKYLGDAPAVRLHIEVSSRHDSIAVAANVGQVKGGANAARSVLHIALVQRSVDYTGSNGISRHAMVVRKLFGDAEGTILSPSHGEETMHFALSMADVEAGVRDLLSDPKSQPSWSNPKRNFTGWRSRPADIDRSNLTVVAWIQNPETHEVLQSASRDVPAGKSAD